MGRYSWLDCINKTQILIEYRKVYLLVPKEFGGGHIEETYYDGYGHFGEFDIFYLIARWNAPEKCNGDFEHDRTIGVDLCAFDKDNAKLKYPIKITHNPNVVYEECKPSMGDPNQGVKHITITFDRMNEIASKVIDALYEDDEEEARYYLENELEFTEEEFEYFGKKGDGKDVEW